MGEGSRGHQDGFPWEGKAHALQGDPNEDDQVSVLVEEGGKLIHDLQELLAPRFFWA